MNTPTPHVWQIAIVVLSCAPLVACGEKKSVPSASAPSGPVAFDKTEFSEITSMADGSAYAATLAGPLWYLRGGKAIRVTIEGASSKGALMFLDITPLTDGGAYATTLDTGVWYLHGEHAEKVSEVPAMPSGETGKVTDTGFSALYLAEHKKRKAAEERASANDPDNRDDTQDDDYRDQP